MTLFCPFWSSSHYGSNFTCFEDHYHIIRTTRQTPDEPQVLNDTHSWHANQQCTRRTQNTSAKGSTVLIVKQMVQKRP